MYKNKESRGHQLIEIIDVCDGVRWKLREINEYECERKYVDMVMNVNIIIFPNDYLYLLREYIFIL